MTQANQTETETHPHVERETETWWSLYEDYVISRGMMTATLPGSELHNFHKARVTYLAPLFAIDTADTKLVE